MSASAELSTQPDIGVVAVLDDDADQAKVVELQLQDVGIKTVIADLDRIPTMEAAVDWIKSEAQAVVCDVQLNPFHGGITYNGAQLMSKLVGDLKMPGVLTTGFLDDVGMWVRRHRSRIPVLVTRDETEEPEVLVEGFETCRMEIDYGRADDRKTHRVPLYIEKASPAETGVALDARVGGWSRKSSMRFPADMLDDKYCNLKAAKEALGKVFFARVNLGALNEADLFFERVEHELFEPDEFSLHFEKGTD